MQMDMFVRNADGKIVPAEITVQMCRKTHRVFLLVAEQRDIPPRHPTISKGAEESAEKGLREALDAYNRMLPERMNQINHSR